MDLYGMSAPECFPIDDLLDFSNDDLFSATMDCDLPSSDNNNNNSNASSSSATAYYNAPNPNHSMDYFADDLCVPCDDVAELEWLSNFVDESLNNFPANEYTGMANFRPDASFHGRSRSKRSRAPCSSTGWTAVPENDSPMIGKSKVKREISLSSVDRSSPSSSDSSQAVRRCTHCASEKTPQWRTGPMGPKTLCNACGVRYKSGRLVPEYRPAASPTFVLTQHSNSHRKVMELRRQKETGGGRQEQQHHQQQLFHHHHHHNNNFEVC